MKASTEEIQALVDFVLPMTGIVDQKDSTVALTLALNLEFDILLKKRILERLRASIFHEISYKDLFWKPCWIRDQILKDGCWGYRKSSWPEEIFVAFQLDNYEIAVGIIFPIKTVLTRDGLNVDSKIIRDKLRLSSDEALKLCREQTFKTKSQNDEWAGWINWTPNALKNDAFIEFALHCDSHAKRIAACIGALAGVIDLVLSEYAEVILPVI